ncbi:MAG: alpha/beta hydrolase [Candidatus Eremiobacteraeota bacterium]|nr:alpha/beta hydrolase [Candidatus Eremiobacteraeota bacterium]
MSAFAATAATPAAAPDLYLRPGTLVHLPQTTLSFYCLGKGKPVVVLEAGLGGRASQWRDVQSALASTTTVCSYDRAGYGFSSPGPEPRMSQRIAGELAAGLKMIGLSGPYVVVATSYGTFDIRLFAHDHPNDIAGAVLVNPSAEQEELQSADPAIERIDAAGLSDAKACLAAAAAGNIKLNSAMSQQCIGSPDDSPAGKVRQALLEQPTFWQALVSEWENIRASAQQVADSNQNFGFRPLIVISAGVEPSYSGLPADQQTALHKFWPMWNRWQDDLAGLSTTSYHVRTSSAERSTERSNPSCVAQAIQAVIAASRARFTESVQKQLCIC